MATYTWNGSSFNEGTLTTQFMLDFYNNLYLYEQNYGGFFTCTVDTSGNPQYDGTVQYATQFIPNGTQFDQAFGYSDSQVTTVTTSILQGRLGIFQSTGTNVVDLTTQDPSSYVTNTITPALSAYGTSEALSEYAPFLNNVNFNFGLQDIMTWGNGKQIINQLAGILSNHQSNLLGIQQGATSIIDFKKKIIRRQTLLANSVRTNQATTQTFMTSGSFGALQSAFPSEFSPFTGVIGNANTISSNNMAGLLPSNLGGGNVQGVITSAIGKVFGGSNTNGVPNIINPIDKFVTDIGDLQKPNANFLNNIPNTGFSSITNQISFINQAVNILNNIVSKIPVTNTIQLPNASTNTANINSALTSFYKAQISTTSTQPAAISTTQKANNQLAILMAQTGPTNTSTIPVSAANYDINDPSQGGSLLNTPVLSSIFNSEEDSTVKAPNINVSPDPSVQANQYLQIISQNQANQPGIVNTPAQGTGFNIFEEIELRPRNNPITGTPGDYNSNPGLPI